MRKIFICTFIIAISVITTCYAAEENQKINYISAFSAQNKYKKDNAILIDAMATRDFEKFHAVGSINLPNDGEGDLQKIRMMDLPFKASDEIVVYCS